MSAIFGERLTFGQRSPSRSTPGGLLPSPILRRESSPRGAARRRAPPCSGALRRAAASRWARGKCRGRGWPSAEACGRGGGAKRAFILPIHRRTRGKIRVAYRKTLPASQRRSHRSGAAQRLDFFGDAVDAAPVAGRLLRRQIARSALHVGEHDVRALRCELQRRGAPDPFHSASARDQRGFSYEITRVRSPRCVTYLAPKSLLADQVLSCDSPAAHPLRRSFTTEPRT